MTPPGSLAALPNLGPASARMLAAAGIRDAAALADCGAVDAWIAVRRSGLPASLNLLWALEGALSGRDWRLVAREDRLRLLTELEARGVVP
ncbi:MAG TPA: TfoX/Sxy family DNA transformation protein [Noviherbaspirillum sp.]|jgi:DNA transformation protein|uniref:TfoX/Sxy family DNA transformation protein n=1 Tax=Noviherbaspirillum sp. TaxID=1926288 RepID=UPI002F9417C7